MGSHPGVSAFCGSGRDKVVLILASRLAVYGCKPCFPPQHTENDVRRYSPGGRRLPSCKIPSEIQAFGMGHCSLCISGCCFITDTGLFLLRMLLRNCYGYSMGSTIPGNVAGTLPPVRIG